MHTIATGIHGLIRLIRRWPALAIGLWAAMMLPGFAYLEHYSNAAGRLADPPASWPASVSIERQPGRYTVVMLAHPMCPCTRASLDELARMMAQVDGRADAYVLFVDAAGTDHTDLWTQAEGIPGVHVITDHASDVATTLGAYTSGQVVVYDPAGKLAFNGGITSARGHEGDNTGESAIVQIIRGGAAPVTTSNVYGCELRAHERQQ